MCWWQNETLKRDSSENFQCEWRRSLLRAKQQVTVPLDMDKVNNVEIFKNGQNSCESVRKLLSENAGTGWQQGSSREGLLHIQTQCLSVAVIYGASRFTHIVAEFRWVIHTEQGGQTKVFQPLCLCIIINVCLHSNILGCFSYSVFIKKYRRFEAGIRTQSNLSEENVCLKLTSWAHKSPYISNKESPQPQLFPQT